MRSLGRLETSTAVFEAFSPHVFDFSCSFPCV